MRAGGHSTSFTRLLFWLKWKIVLRGYQRNSTALAGVLLGVLVFVPFMGLAAFGSYLLYTSLPPPAAGNVLQSVLMGAYFFWILSPMLGFAVNETFDVTKLFAYPISVRQILFGAVAGSVLDFPVLFLLPSLGAALVGFSSGAISGALIAFILLLFLAHTLALGQSLILATAGMLRSRKYRDLLMVLVPLIWIVYYVVQEMMRRGSIELDWSAFFKSAAWRALGWLPPGMAAKAISAASHGDYGIALAYSALLAAITAGALFVAAWVIQKVYAGETDVFRPGKGGGGRKSSGGIVSPAKPARLLFGLRLPPEAEAVYLKEARYMARDPSFKAALMNLIYTLLVAVFMVLPRQEQRAIGWEMEWMLWPAACVVLLSEVRFFFNLFGTEGAAASLFFLYPAARRRLLIGKDVIYLLAGVTVNSALAMVLCAIAQAPAELPYLLFFMLLSTGIFLAAGNVISVVYPMRVVAKGWKVRQTSAGQGCAYAFIYMGVSVAVFAALIPVLAAIWLPRLWIGEAWLVVSLPLAVLYAVAASAMSLKHASRLLLEREIEVLQKLGAEE